ncbi:DsbA family oxidoreductase [Formosa sp. S-31]|uniref:DsbA family oxidoreductase n=1 Tax=Formosa sp. S-31 TaxID=2790949 RepID=UPI003EB8ED47
MLIKIWSDIRCPFCYIGKRHFESALEHFPNKEQIQIEWKSFELDPNLKTAPQTDALTHFIESKGVERSQAELMFSNVSNMALQAGLTFNLEQSIPANTLNAHRLLHIAKQESPDLAYNLKEALLKAHLSEGKNIDDTEVLIAIAAHLGMDSEKTKYILESDDFIYDVRQDEMEARNLGISGVPFFVIDNKYGISGAQPVSVFTETLEKAWDARKEELEIINSGSSCDIDGNCN